MRQLLLLGTLMFTVFLVGCDTHSGNDDANVEDYEVLNIRDETTEGDFTYRLVSEKEQYEENEPLEVYAELEYTGEKEEIEIFHAMSPFYFHATEKTRGYDIDQVMPLPLASTTLKSGESIKTEYKGGGVYSESHEDEYVEFIKEVMDKDRFPNGYYVVNGKADFYIENDDDSEKEEEYVIEGQIEFKVTE